MKSRLTTIARRLTTLAFCLSPALAVRESGAQTAWQPSPGHEQIRIWPGAAPNARTPIGHEISGIVFDKSGKAKLVGGKPWVYVDSVSSPTITIYPAQGSNTGVTVLVFPGGGYNVLAIDLEGTEACDWLTPRGITCVLLKYRVPCAVKPGYRDCLTALQDAQRAMGLLRLNAAKWHIDPQKIGVLGFSAGGHMIAALSTHFDKRLYRAVDAADDQSCRPDFAVGLYPGHIVDRATNFVPNPDIRVPKNAPPTLLVQAQDDPTDPVENSLVYYSMLQKAGVSAEIHLFAKGGHAFGLRPTDAPITRWPELMMNWLAEIGMISK